MNPIIKKTGLKIGLILAAIQIGISLYLYNYDSFLNKKIGVAIIVITIVFGVFSIVNVKRKLEGKISLRESFSSYFITILISVLISNLFYLGLFNFVASEEKRETVRKEFYDFNLKNYPIETTNKQKQPQQPDYKSMDPFTISVVINSIVKYLLIYSIFGILISLFFRNKISFEEINS